MKGGLLKLKENNPYRKEAPTGVKIISVLNYISAAILLVLGILATILGIVLAVNPDAFGDAGALTAILTVLGAFTIFAGIIMILFGILNFFIARGLWNGRNWARILTIILSIISILTGIGSIFTGDILGGLVSLIIPAIIAGYLLFSENVKEFFNQ